VIGVLYTATLESPQAAPHPHCSAGATDLLCSISCSEKQVAPGARLQGSPLAGYQDVRSPGSRLTAPGFVH
jgi:hypothetical protein